jgi:hypothetical protein
MNTQRDKLRRQERLAAIAQEKALDKAEREGIRERLPAITALSEVTAIRRSPDKLPDPWLFDSEALLRELDRCRELVVQIPVSNPQATHFGINVALAALWNLQQHLRFLLSLHREGQRAFANRHAEQLKDAQPAQPKIQKIRA